MHENKLDSLGAITAAATRRALAVGLAFAIVSVTGCVGFPITGNEPASAPAPAPAPTSQKAAPVATPAQAARLKRLMVPLLSAMNRPIRIDQVSVGLINDPQINAANAGSGRFFVTTGLLEQANDSRLLAVLAHEIAHEDLNHVAKAQVRAAGLGIGAALIEQIFPGSGQVVPLAGELVTRKYSRSLVGSS
jgi:Zn-dependent protease with chaperone function